MRTLLKAALLSGAGLLLAAQARSQAIEPYRGFEDFRGRTIDPARWANSEQSRRIRHGALELMQRVWPGTGSDVGVIAVNYNESFLNPNGLNAIKARVRVDDVKVSACPANPAVGDSRARILGGFFNAGAPQAGTQTNDVIAQLRVIRRGDSADPEGVLRVDGVVSQCTNADCSLATTIGTIVDLGTVRAGRHVSVELQWDPDNDRFLFSRDHGRAAGEVYYGAVVSDALPPTLPFKQLSTRLVLPNCQTGPRISGMIDASFDSVWVNRSYAAP